MWVRHYQIGVLYSHNFSLGVYLFSKIVSEAARLLFPTHHYDPALLECHHQMKQDAPSGTALALGKAILEKWPTKTRLSHTSPANPEALSVSTLRVGHVPGTHTVVFDSSADRITCTHEAFNRQGFAEGAVLAAEWLHGKQGFFTFEDMF
jgi:4-hydroxy-tetrahydrodipicolinate reductase